MATTVPITLKLITELPMAWRHHCGKLNDGPWPSAECETICLGCRCDVHLNEVEARYLLVGTS